MKAVLIITVVAAAAAQYHGNYGRLGHSVGGYSAVRFGGGVKGSGFKGGATPGVVHGSSGGGYSVVSGGGYGVVSGGGYGVVDLSLEYSDYHFSWRHDGGKKYDWHTANYYCSSLGKGWQGVSIETPAEDKIISDIIYKSKLEYIWTGGYRKGYEFAWPSGYPFYGINWSRTGGEGRPQPDNREDGKEFCLAVLNNFYKDGITWHDVACHHEKPIICERRRGAHYG